MLGASVAFDLSRLPQGWTPNPERLQSSLTDSELSTEQTVRKMCELIREGAAHPLIRSIAERLGRWADGSGVKVCWDAFWFCKHHVRFAVDETAVLALFGEQNQVDFLMSPPVLLAMRRPAGDCDDFTMLCCALLECRGIPWEIVTIACDRAEPGRWSHVYCRAILPDGRRLALDPTNGRYPGWEVPAVDVFRRQFWNSSGQPVDGPESIRDTRMHAYRRRGMGDPLDIPQASVAENTIVDVPAGIFNDPSRVNYDPSGGVWSSISSGGSGGGGFLNTLEGQLGNIIKTGGNLATIALTPKGGYVSTDARGNMIVSNTGLPVATAGAGNLIFYGILALGAFMVIRAVSK